MLQTLNIPSNPLTEVPSAAPGAPGDAGERAEFAHLLQQAKSADAEGARDEPAVRSEHDVAKDRRGDTRVRTTHDHKRHDARKVRSGTGPVEADGSGCDEAAGLRKQDPRGEAPAITIDTVAAAPAPRSDDDRTVAPIPDALPLPVSMHGTEPPPAATAVAGAATAPVPSDERGTGTRLAARSGVREQPLSVRADAKASTAADNGATQALPSRDIALPQAKEAAFDLALRGAASGRATSAPLFDRTPIESTPAAAQALAFARELAQPAAARGDAVAEAALHAAPDEAMFAPALGAQVALWVKDGVQEARLQLHPAELGPVSVQIAIEGQAAHVDFTAAVAATRDSIEQSLPALAAALRESGFTLAGGGVFGGRPGQDSGRERTTEGRGHGTRGTAAIGAEGANEAAMPQARRWSRSLVDVYA